MRRTTLFAAVALCGLGQADAAILFEDFEDSSGFTLGGSYDHGWIYWGLAPLGGTVDLPSNFVQGGSQAGTIFYGSFAKDGSNPSPTMTIDPPDLTAYTDLTLTVSLAAPVDIFESTHRDSLRITSDTGTIDEFLPTGRPSSLQSDVHAPRELRLEFQDFVYNIENTLDTVTFTFASTAGVEVVGIDSVTIAGPDADFDSDGDVDGDDFLLWQAGFATSQTGHVFGDADNDGDTDGDDFLIWQSQFASGSGTASAAVPEPTSVMLLAVILGAVFFRRQHSSD